MFINVEEVTDQSVRQSYILYLCHIHMNTVNHDIFAYFNFREFAHFPYFRDFNFREFQSQKLEKILYKTHIFLDISKKRL